MIPIALFVYNRLDKAEHVYSSLINNDESSESELYVFADGPKTIDDEEKVNEVRELINRWKSQNAFKKVYIFEQSKNIGLAQSIIGGVSYVLDRCESVIVVEDDLIVSPYFLKYMNDALVYYNNDRKIGSVAAYIPKLKGLEKLSEDTFLIEKSDCWGWGTWRDRWYLVDWKMHDYDDYCKKLSKRIKFEHLQTGIDEMLELQMQGKIDSWAVRWVYNLFNLGLKTVYPKVSMVKNDGFDGSGRHCNITDEWNVDIAEETISVGDAKLNKKLQRENGVYNSSRKKRIICIVRIIKSFIDNRFI